MPFEGSSEEDSILRKHDTVEYHGPDGIWVVDSATWEAQIEQRCFQA
jgi:hypothetical protein